MNYIFNLYKILGNIHFCNRNLPIVKKCIEVETSLGALGILFVWEKTTELATLLPSPLNMCLLILILGINFSLLSALPVTVYIKVLIIVLFAYFW